jgi:SH3-like domain-containing protein
MCVGQGWIAPHDFWRLYPGELWMFIDAKIPRDVAQEIEGRRELYDFYRAQKDAERQR